MEFKFKAGIGRLDLDLDHQGKRTFFDDKGSGLILIDVFFQTVPFAFRTEDQCTSDCHINQLSFAS